MATVSSQTIGGYDYKFADDKYIKYTCPICALVARDPQQASCCGQVYCEVCIQSLKRRGINFTCPKCRHELADNHFFDKRTDLKVKSLQVYCNNKGELIDDDSTCQWKGNLKDIEDHLQKCPYQSVSCSNDCGMNLQQRHLHEHLENDCPKRLVKCLFCEEEGTYQFTTGGHLEICLVYPIGCTNAGCNQQIPRQLMPSHKEACPKEIIPCQYGTVGCKEKIIREEQDEHNEKWVKQHLQLAVEEVKSTKQKLEPLQHQLKKLEANNKKFASKLVEMKNSHEIQLTDAQLRIKKLEQSHVEMVQKQNKKSFLWRLNKFDETPNWYSPGLYTSPGGYKMCLRVAANNLDEYLSCYIYLMSGKHDDLLTWPFSGQVTIELLNQLEDNNHHSETFNFNDSTPEDIKSRVIDQQRSPDGWGIRKFLRLTELNFNPSLNCQYLKDNVLCFRVSVVVTSKPWLIPSNY